MVQLPVPQRLVPTGEEAGDPPPQRPPEPDAADCCGEGCARCVFDVYEEALLHYEAELAAWRARQS
ncbi:hypothetical protein B0E46_16755 [Rhodanobacter sp. B04]|uniref:oxidoreductase-like domain-containing protein n=1 Tax=Rhodanobacter sp. B04 TaxID=1945860 RepID=UPI000985F5C5|nr:oxidoreductase-like domain-containing protein [Rhodanobacter sp. B04]OOG61706.1 hypothetical protein B0E46_16755 [Rhodanobacter sp. B04]